MNAGSSRPSTASAYSQSFNL